MSHSIRLRFVDWLQSIRDHVAEKLVQVLRRDKVQSHAARNIGKGIVVGIDDSGSECQCDYPVSLTSLQKQIDILNGSAVVANFQPAIANRDFAPGSNNNFLNHQPSPFGKNYLDSLIPKQVEVEGRG